MDENVSCFTGNTFIITSCDDVCCLKTLIPHHPADCLISRCFFLLAEGFLIKSEHWVTVFGGYTRGDCGLLCFSPCDAAAEAADEKSAALCPPQRRWEMLLKMKFTLLLIPPFDAASRLSRAFWRRFVYPACLPRCLPSTPLRGVLQSSPRECQSN